MEKINLALVDDHNLFRNGLKLLLNKVSGELFENIYEATNGLEFLQLLAQHPVDIALMDISMPVMNGIEATQKALEMNSGLRVIALTMFNEHDYYSKMINAGVKGFLLKEAEIDEVLNAIKAVSGGNNYFSVEILCTIIKKQNEPQGKNEYNLSGRELEILYLICQGLSNKDIAKKLFLSKRTVDKHRYNILEKTDCKNTANLVMFAVKNQLVHI